MNANVEVVAAEAVVEMTATIVKAAKGIFSEVVIYAQVAATSTLRFLRQGRSSLSAVPGDVFNILNGGEAVAF